MAAKLRFRSAAAAARCTALHRGRVAIVGLASAIGFLAFAGPGVADTGSVYVDSSGNVAAGHDFFNASFTGFDNVVLDYSVLPNLTSGSFDTAIGHQALISNASGSSNVASGAFALRANTTGSSNIATGTAALTDNGAGHDNLAVGTDALGSNTTGDSNLALGNGALFANTTADANVASGRNALVANTTGHDNTAEGYRALRANDTGSANVAIGSGAGQSLTTGSENVDIANPGRAGESGTIRIGRPTSQTAAYLAGIDGTPIPGPAQPVLVNAKGQLGTASSAASTGGTVGELRAENRREDEEIAAQRRQIATLKREVQRLSRR